MEFNLLKCEFINFSQNKTQSLTPTKSNIQLFNQKKIQCGTKTPLTLPKKLPLDQVAYGELFPHTLHHLHDGALSSPAKPILEYLMKPNLARIQYTEIESILIRAARIVNKIERTNHATSTTKLINELEWQTPKSRREQQCLRFYHAIHSSEVKKNTNSFLRQTPATHKHNNTHYTVPYLLL